MKKKVAIIRGPGLSKWEMQIYEPLTEWFNLLGLGAKKPVNDICNISFPLIQLYCPGQDITRIPKLMNLMFRFFGDTQQLLGFDQSIQGCDLLHSVELGNAFSLQAVRAKQKGLVCAVTLTIYENIPFLFDQFPARQRAKKEVIAWTDHFLAANNCAREALLAEGVSDEKISIVPQSVDTRRFSPRMKESRAEILKSFSLPLALENDDFVVLSAARLVWEKGLFDILRAAAAVKYKSKRIKFLVVGDGPEEEKLKKFVMDHNLSKMVIITGPVPYHQMPIIFRLADLFVLASLPTPIWQEQFGGVLIEAMASGLPIIGTCSGGIKETVGEEGGIFIQPQDFSALAGGILHFFAKPESAHKTGSRNRKLAVEKYDHQVVALKIKKIWENVLEEK